MARWDEMKARIDRIVQQRLADVPDEDTVRAQAICDQLAAELTAIFTRAGAAPPSPLRLTVTSPGVVEVGFEGDDLHPLNG